MYIADLHIHSRYSLATSRDCDAPHLELWARNKGVQLIGTGDFTHPAWRGELAEQLEEAGQGVYRLKPGLSLEGGLPADGETRFVVSGEISTIYKRDGRTRKVHSLILLPGLLEASRLSARLEKVGNIHSDGRPILGMDCRDLLELTMETCPEAVFIPAHIWTPHFSVLGAFSGFSSMEECFGELTGCIHAVETGLSSDPPMNWRVGALERFTLISNSDAHSPSRLAREANLLQGEMDYPSLKRSLETGDGLIGTIEFFPQEGKYHLDGHRGCGVCLSPQETLALGGRCPVCGRKLTVGVEHRVRELADRPEDFRPPNARPFESLAPLAQVLSACWGCGAQSKAALEGCRELTMALGPELCVLRAAALEDIARLAGPLAAEGVSRLRAGRVLLSPGYDGEYGQLSLFKPGEREALAGQASLFPLSSLPGLRGNTPLRGGAYRQKAAPPQAPQDSSRQDSPAPHGSPCPEGPSHAWAPPPGGKNPAPSPSRLTPPPAGTEAEGNRPALHPALACLLSRLNPQQRGAASTAASALCVIAGPGTGKTKTLTARAAYLLMHKHVPPEQITAVTFTRQAALELKARLRSTLGEGAGAENLQTGTFHSICLRLLGCPPPLSPGEARALMELAIADCGSFLDPLTAVKLVSALKNCLPLPPPQMEAAQAVCRAYSARCRQEGRGDFDDLLLWALALPDPPPPCFTHLLVDEFQDVNALQRRLVRRWAHPQGSLFVIGDPDQSIYGFRGADAECFARLTEDIPGMETTLLSGNYRSTPEILTCALKAISPNPGGERLLLPHRPRGKPVRLITLDSPFTEGVWISKEIIRLTGGTDMLSAQRIGGDEPRRAFSDVAVLCRTHRQLECIEQCLSHDGIPCQVAGRGPELEDARGRAAMDFFRFIAGEQALLAPDTLTAAYGVAPERTPELLGLLGEHPCARGQVPQPLQNVFPSAFTQDVTAFSQGIKSEPPSRLLSLWSALHGGSEGMDRLIALAGFHTAMESFLLCVCLGEEGDLLRASGKAFDSGAVRLTTIHGAKGLEYPVVFLAGVTEGLLPLTRNGETENPLEERRLLYVALTRAREELILSCSPPPSPWLEALRPFLVPQAPGPARPPRGKQLSLF